MYTPLRAVSDVRSYPHSFPFTKLFYCHIAVLFQTLPPLHSTNYLHTPVSDIYLRVAENSSCALLLPYYTTVVQVQLQ